MAGKVGGQSNLPVDDPNVVRLIEDSLKKLETEEGSTKKYKHIEILSATVQVVSGVLYRIKASVILTEADINDPKPRNECKELEGAQQKICEFEIWERAWLNDQQIKIK